MNKRYYSLIAFVACVFFVLIFASLSYPALYKWIDKDGQPHITDYPDPSKAPTRVEPIQQPITPPMQQLPPETEPISQPPSKEDSYIAEPPKEPISPPATTTQKPAAPPSIPKDLPVPKGAPEFPVGIGYIFIILLAMYFYASLCLFLIAKKLGVPSPVFAWIPLIQVWTFVVAAKGTGGHPCLWILSMAIPVAGPIIGIYLWMCIAENLGKNKWLALLMLLPLIGFVLMGWLAFSKEETRVVQATTPNI